MEKYISKGKIEVTGLCFSCSYYLYFLFHVFVAVCKHLLPACVLPMTLPEQLKLHCIVECVLLMLMTAETGDAQKRERYSFIYY